MYDCSSTQARQKLTADSAVTTDDHDASRDRSARMYPASIGVALTSRSASGCPALSILRTLDIGHCRALVRRETGRKGGAGDAHELAFIWSFARHGRRGIDASPDSCTYLCPTCAHGRASGMMSNGSSASGVVEGLG